MCFFFLSISRSLSQSTWNEYGSAACSDVRSASNGIHVLCLRFDYYFFYKPNGMCKGNLFFHLTWRPLDFSNAPRYTQTTNAIKKANETKRKKRAPTISTNEVKAYSIYMCHYPSQLLRKRSLTSEWRVWGVMWQNLPLFSLQYDWCSHAHGCHAVLRCVHVGKEKQ